MRDPLHQAVTQALAGVVDPESGLDLVAMGMIYEVRVAGGIAEVAMTTTTRGCPLSEMLREGVEAALRGIPGVSDARVRLTWDPPWTPEYMAPAAFGAGRPF